LLFGQNQPPDFFSIFTIRLILAEKPPGSGVEDPRKSNAFQSKRVSHLGQKARNGEAEGDRPGA
jgi:hypothetical protein